MTITELIFPQLKQDPASILYFQSSVFPALSTCLSKLPNSRLHVSGHMIEEDGVSTQGSFRPVLGASWLQEKDIHAFIATEEFQALLPGMMSVSVARSQPQLFETNRDPDAVFSSALMEVYRIKISNETAVAEAKKTWEVFTSTIVKASDATEIHLLSGTSLNLEEKTFVGVIGWNNNEVREATLKDTTVVSSRTVLLDFKDATSFLASFKEYQNQGA